MNVIQGEVDLDLNFTYLDNKTLDIQSETFYDRYDEVPGNFPADFPVPGNTAIKGQIAYTKTYYEDETKKVLITANYYDDKYRVVKTVATNHLGGKDIIYNTYDFTGKITDTRQEHTVNSVITTIAKHFDYDHAGRLTETLMDINNSGSFKSISKETYNEIGQLENKKVHNTSGAEYLINTGYSYNIRGWMTKMDYKDKINQPVFELDLAYNSGAFPQYNGNISRMTWTSPRFASNFYDFDYDNLNRLEKALYNGLESGNYSTSYDYDENGNIKNLNRNGKGETSFGDIDKLIYTYNGNQLIGVKDEGCQDFKDYGFAENSFTDAIPENQGTHEYLYDNNGNLYRDDNKKITNIIYNHLNLPEAIHFENGNLISYLYDAAGCC